MQSSEMLLVHIHLPVASGPIGAIISCSCLGLAFLRHWSLEVGGKPIACLYLLIYRDGRLEGVMQTGSLSLLPGAEMRGVFQVEGQGEGTAGGSTQALTVFQSWGQVMQGQAAGKSYCLTRVALFFHTA